MWSESNQDPGGSSTELDELKDQSEQQQKLIAQLKEMLRKTESTPESTLERAEKLSSTLSKMQSRAKRNKEKKSQDDKVKTVGDTVTPASEKMNLLKKQMEENRAKLAERGKHQKGIEDKVSQLKAQLDEPVVLQPVEQIKIEYSSETPSTELFLLVNEKDRQINELNARIRVFEGNVLDLQENLKEKDSVIDARTKAITLLTEDLSRRGKSTLDMLDETKDEMRKMQESFIKLETEMKEENQQLQIELTAKNQLTQDFQLKIQELENQKSEKEISLENQNSDLERQVNELKEQLRCVDHDDKTKKQLDEMNKSMIKLKAQNKAKVKDLQKQLEIYKQKDNDDWRKDMEIENEKLKQKIVELEEEKGNLQLSLMEFDTKKVSMENLLSESSFVGSDLEETLTELKSKLANLEKIVEEKDETITQITSERHSLLNELENSHLKLEDFNNRLAELRHLEHEQVRTELTSAQLEEQIDHLKLNNLELERQVATISNENIALHDRIDCILMEKSELNSKIDNLIHENMDLLDRLEKAEKVSSAESIEIVEALTQQEKLEIEEYNSKYPEELNESVSKLSDESAELLEKIELFTVERKEVMEKMEYLNVENGELKEKLAKLDEEYLDKIRVLEMEKLQLEETYEQLHENLRILEEEKSTFMNDFERDKLEKMEDLNTENEELKEKLKLGEEQIKKIEILELEKLELEEKYKQSYESLKTLEIEKVKLMEDMEKQFNEKLANLEEEKLEYYKNLIQQQKSEIDELKNQVIQTGVEKGCLEEKLQELLKEKESLSETLDVSNIEIEKLKSSLDNYKETDFEAASLRSELQNLTETLTTNITKITEYEKQNTQLNFELNSIQNQISENENLLVTKEFELENLQTQNQNLQSELTAKNTEIQNIITNFQEKYVQLQANIEGNITEKGDKMKKLMGALKKKTGLLEELQIKYKEKETILEEVQKRVEILETEKLELKNKFGHEIQEKENKITELIQKNQQLVEEVNRNQQQLHTKLQEQEMVIESLETEKNNLANKNQQLTETVSVLQSQNEENFMNLQQQLQENLHRLNEALQLNNAFERELNDTKTSLKNAEMRINELLVENNELGMGMNELAQTVAKLREEAIKNNEDEFEKIRELEEINTKLAGDLNHLENELRKVQTELKLERESRQTELDKYESESNTQYEEFEQQRHKLQELNDKLIQEISELQQKVSESETEVKYLQEQDKEYEVQASQLRQSYDQKINTLQQVIKDKNQEMDHLDNTYKVLLQQFNDSTAYYENIISEREKMILPAEETVIKTVNYSTESVPVAPVEDPVIPGLIEKIKTLQFMLHDSEKSKDDAVEICMELLNEITRREYDTQTKELKELTPEIIHEVDSQVEVPQETEEPQPVLFSQNLFTNTSGVEELIEPKVAYQCGNEATFFETEIQRESVTTSEEVPSELVLDSDDFFGTQEAFLDAQHVQNNDLLEKYNKLEKDHQNLVEKYKQLKAKSAKTIKKLKEQQQGGFGDLEMAIVDELKGQIQHLEKVVKDLKMDKEKSLVEKENLLKQIDVLTTANERMVEMKERQDIDIQLWQRKHQELSEKIDQLEWDIDEEPKKSSPKKSSPESSDLQRQVQELTTKVNDLSIDNEELQALLEEQSQLRLELDRKLQNSLKETETNLEFENLKKEKEIVNEKLREVELRLEEAMQLKAALEIEITQSHGIIQENQFQIQNLNSQIETLQNSETSTIQNLFSAIQQKDQEIQFLQNNSTNEQLEQNLQNYLSVIEVLKQEKEDLEMKTRRVLEEMEELRRVKDNEIEELRLFLKQEIEELEVRNSEEIQKLELQVKLKNEEILKLQNVSISFENQLEELRSLLKIKDEEIYKLRSNPMEIQGDMDPNLIEEYKSELGVKNEELLKLGNNLKELENKILTKDEEINYLRNTPMVTEEVQQLRQLQIDNEIELQNQLIDLQLKDEEIEKLTHEFQIQLKFKDEEILKLTELVKSMEISNSKEVEIENLKELCAIKEKDMNELREQLLAKVNECQELQSKCTELDYMINEDTKQMSDLKNIIETQVLKIEELKNPKPTNEPQKHVHFPDQELVTQHYYESESNAPPQTENPDPPSELVSRAELELCMYMLHQRDVRVEELTVELMQLLEERDTLQLRLSNSIRTNEELRRQIDDKSGKDGSIPPSSPGRSEEILIRATGAEIAKEATESSLQNKISELHTVDYRRDLRVKEDQENRHLQQISMMQSQRDLAMLPPEAAQRLMDANYTLSRESESASTVLLNWIWGRGTPKVNHQV